MKGMDSGRKLLNFCCKLLATFVMKIGVEEIFKTLEKNIIVYIAKISNSKYLLRTYSQLEQ